MAAPFLIGTLQCAPGRLATGYLESVYLYDGTRLRVPLIVIHGAQPGRVLWVGSTLHGDEIPGCEVIRRLTKTAVDPARLRGTVIAAPVQHPLSFFTASRNTAHDGVNINRVFPGNPEGTVTERFAHDLFQQGLMRADVILDIHSNAPGAVSFNIVRTGQSGPAWDAQWPLAEAFGITVAVGRLGQTGLTGMLQDACLGAGKPALTVELAGGHFWEEASVQAGVRGVLNVMKFLEMVDGTPEPQSTVQVIPGRLSNRHYLHCRTGGLVRPLRPLGGAVRRDEPVVAVDDVFGNELEVLTSPIDGWVITYPVHQNRTATSGDPLAFVFGYD
jgi:predicted deacylase